MGVVMCAIRQNLPDIAQHSPNSSTCLRVVFSRLPH